MLLLVATFAFAQEPAPAPTPAPAPATTTEPVPVLKQANAPKTILFPARAANLGPAEVRAVEILFRRRFEEVVVDPTFPEETVAAAVAASTTDDKGLLGACTALACSSWITIDLVRLDKEIFITVLERDATAAVVQKVETTVMGLDALPGAIDRVARAVASRQPLDAIPVARVPVVVDAATPPTVGPRPTRKRETESVAGFKFGVHGPLWPNFQIALSHAFTWRRERKNSFFELDAGFTVPLGLSDDRTWGMAFFEVGMAHIFNTKGNIAFYAGGGLGPRAGGYDDTGIGLGVFGEGGVLFGRPSSSRAFVQAKLGGDVFTGFVEPYIVSYAGIEAGVGF